MSHDEATSAEITREVWRLLFGSKSLSEVYAEVVSLSEIPFRRGLVKAEVLDTSKKA